MDSSPRYGRFRALLRKIREEAGLNQWDLAAKLGKPQTYVSKVEIGERRLDFLEALDFCAACNVTASRFIARLEKLEASIAAPTRVKRRSPRRMDGHGRLSE